MALSSALEAIESSTVSALESVQGIASAKAVPLVDLFRPGAEEPDIDLIYTPDAYPGATVSLNDDEVQVEHSHPIYQSQPIIYRAPVYVGIFTTTDGTLYGGARHAAWEIAEAVIRTLAVMTPSGMPDGAQAFGPLMPGPIESWGIDGNTHALVMKWWSKFRIA